MPNPDKLKEILQELLGKEIADVTFIDLDKILKEKGPQLAIEAATRHAERMIESIALIGRTNWDQLLIDLSSTEGCKCGGCKIQMRYLRKMCHEIRQGCEPVRRKLAQLADEATEALRAAEKVDQGHVNPNN